jgi:creatinine amidohydrolase/Fe(II)-dependent formamide hydrolase-like protein
MSEASARGGAGRAGRRPAACAPWVAALLLCASAHAAPAASTSLELLTWPELKAQIAAGSTTVLVPIGGTEQNGPHMALGKHNVRVRLVAGRIADRLGNAIVAPVVAYVPEGSIDPPTEHMRYPGTISIPVPVFEATIEAAARSFRQHGFRDIVLLGDHGGYAASLERVAARLNKEWRADPRVRVHALGEYYRAAQSPYADDLKARGLSAAQIGSHAGVADTSLMLALDASLVRADVAAARSPGTGGDGVVGDPRRSSAEFGQIGVERIVDASVLAIRARTAAPR